MHVLRQIGPKGWNGDKQRRLGNVGKRIHDILGRECDEGGE